MRKSVASQVLTLRKRAGLSLEDLAQRMGYRRASSIQRYESETDFRGDYLASKIAIKYAKALSGLGSPPIQEREVLELAGPLFSSSGERQVPVISLVQAGSWTEIADPYPMGHGSAIVVADMAVGQNAFALEIEGPSMMPRFQEGDRIVVDPDIEPIPGDLVVAKLESEQKATFKQYRPRGFDAKKRPIIELRPLNDEWPTIPLDAQNPGRIIGVMVEHHSYRRSGRR